MLDLDGDLFGLEVNLASKIGEDMARPGQALLTPAAADALRGAARRPWSGAARSASAAAPCPCTR